MHLMFPATSAFVWRTRTRETRKREIKIKLICEDKLER